jgi:hypothetical protein
MVKINEAHPGGYTDSDAEDTDSETLVQHELIWVSIGHGMVHRYSSVINNY